MAKPVLSQSNRDMLNWREHVEQHNAPITAKRDRFFAGRKDKPTVGSPGLLRIDDTVAMNKWLADQAAARADTKFLRDLRIQGGLPQASAPVAPQPIPGAPGTPQPTPGAPDGSAPSAPGVAPITPSSKYSREPDAIPPTGTGPGIGPSKGRNPLSIAAKKFRTLTGLGSASFNVSGTPTGIRLF